MTSEELTRRDLFRVSAYAAGVVAAAFVGNELYHKDFSNGRVMDDRDIPDPVARTFKMPDGGEAHAEVSKEYYLEVFTEERGMFSQNHPEGYIKWSQVDPFAEYLWELSNEDPVEYVANSMDFIALNTEYMKDGKMGFTKYPLETLWDGGGDCEDLSVLAGSMFAWAGVRTGVVVSPKHAAVAISFDEPEESTDYPRMKKAAELFDDAPHIDSINRFDRDNIDPHNIIIIPESMTISGARSRWNQMNAQNRKYYGQRITQHMELEENGAVLTFERGPIYLTREEETTLPIEEALELQKKRKLENPEIAREFYRKHGISVGKRERTRGLKYFYLEPTSFDKWLMYDRLPIEMTFFPAPDGKYRKDRSE